jgi:hypothetical protein
MGYELSDRRSRLSAASAALPAALVVWRLGTRLLGQAGNNPNARRWARIGAAAAALAGLSVILVGVSGSADPRRLSTRELDDRLESELEDSFPASDAPAITRPGA